MARSKKQLLVKIQVVAMFKDKVTKEVYKVGQTIEVSEERATELERQNLIVRLSQ